MAVQKQIEAHPELAYRMGIPAARVAEDYRVHQLAFWSVFPQLEIFVPLPFCVASIICNTRDPEQCYDAKRSMGISVALALLMVVFRCVGHLYTEFKIATASAEEVCVFVVPRLSQIGTFYQGRFSLLATAESRSAADGPMHPHEKVLGGSQLVGSVRDPADPTTRVVAWDLRLFQDCAHGNEFFQTCLLDVPVDCSTAQDFSRWLSIEPVRSMFGFVGKVVDSSATDNIWRNPPVFDRFAQQEPLLQEDSCDFEKTVVLTAHISYLSSDLLAISLVSVGGLGFLDLQAPPSDRITNFCHVVSTSDVCAFSQIQIVLPDGRSLGCMNGMAFLDDLIR